MATLHAPNAAPHTVVDMLRQGLDLDRDRALALARQHGLNPNALLDELSQEHSTQLQQLLVGRANADLDARLGPVLERVRLLFRRYILMLRPHAFSGLEGVAIEREVLRFLSQPSVPPENRELLDEIQATLDDEDRWSLSAQYAHDEASVWMRLAELQAGLNLDPLARDVLWVLVAPELEPRYLWMYRCITGDAEQVSWPADMVQGLIDPHGQHLDRVRHILGPHGALRRLGLIRALNPNRLDVGHRYRADLNLIRFALDAPQESGPIADVATFMGLDKLQAENPFDIFSPSLANRIRRAFRKKRRLLLIGPPGSGAPRLARRMQAGLGAPLITVKAEELLGEEGPDRVASLLRETLLERAGLLIQHTEALEAERLDVKPWQLARLLNHLSACRSVLYLTASTTITPRLQLQLTRVLGAEPITLPALSLDTRDRLWTEQLSDHTLAMPIEEVVAQARTWPIDIDRISEAVEIAASRASQRTTHPKGIDLKDIEYACSEMTTPKLRQLAVRVQTRFTWNDIVLPETCMESIQDLLNFGRYSSQVLDGWGFAQKMPYGRGLSAMLSGPSGTGKTMVSGLIAKELGKELYRIDLSQIVSKYIGETEEHLASLFEEAVAGDVALLFDEADSLFGKRTSVKSSVDRYANLEVNFLLQKIEEFDGLILLTTNFPSSIDDAFMRRLKFKIHFPKPDETIRAKLWNAMLPTGAPLDDDMELDKLAHQFELTGGQIKNAVFRAALYAAEEGCAIGHDHLERAALLEYREAGRIVFESSFNTITRPSSL